jgi:hypothetical protein
LTAVNKSATALHRYVQGGSFADDGSAAAAWVVTLGIQTSGPLVYVAPGGRFSDDRARTGISVAGTFDAGGSAKFAVATIIADVSTAFYGTSPTYSAYWKEVATGPTSNAELAAAAATDTEISEFIGHDAWVVAGHFMVAVTGATAVTVAPYHAFRSGAVEPGFAGDLAVTEGEFNA